MHCALYPVLRKGHETTQALHAEALGGKWKEKGN